MFAIHVSYRLDPTSISFVDSLRLDMTNDPTGRGRTTVEAARVQVALGRGGFEYLTLESLSGMLLNKFLDDIRSTAFVGSVPAHVEQLAIGLNGPF